MKGADHTLETPVQESRTVVTRRAWVTSTANATLRATMLAKLAAAPRSVVGTAGRLRLHPLSTWWGETEVPQTLAQRAVAVAQHAGAQYADARLTRTIQHRYDFNIPSVPYDMEMVGMGVRALVDGYWGFAACPSGDVTTVERLARTAVAQARQNATGGLPRTVAMGAYPPVTGTWMTPVQIDPFAVSIEEKGDYITYWMARAEQCGVIIDAPASYLRFTRQEGVTATSDGSLVTQTRVESGGKISCGSPATGSVRLDLDGLQTTGEGWELFATVAKIPEQLAGMRDRLLSLAADQARSRPCTVGRYTLVCDGATMASLVGKTLGLATQLDRALGYEANAGGTSFVDDPLTMVGNYQIAAPQVTITANRSAPAQLATVQWDDEGVVPQPFTLIQDGVLVDFQTTREQAAWLAPYYQAHGQPMHSHGCAIGQDALAIPLQQRPNLALVPSPAAVRVEELVADVQDGILVTAGETVQVDFQARNGLVLGTMHKITNGRMGPRLVDGAVLFNTLDLFKHVRAVGGGSTLELFTHTPYDPSDTDIVEMLWGHWKGEPGQDTSYSVRAPAATIVDQAVINPSRKA